MLQLQKHLRCLNRTLHFIFALSDFVELQIELRGSLLLGLDRKLGAHRDRGNLVAPAYTPAHLRFGCDLLHALQPLHGVVPARSVRLVVIAGHREGVTTVFRR